MTSPPTAADYDIDAALDDIPAIKHASSLFLDSKMIEAEQYCLKVDPQKERLYITSGYSLIQCLKAVMSYEDNDLQEAILQVKHGQTLAAQCRAPSPSLVSRITGLIWENSSSGIASIKAMSPVQRHAELLYAETTFAKALLGVVCSGSWLSFLTEALKFRSMINIYLQLGKFIDTMDAEAEAREEGPEDKFIDKDFRSGVELGVGASNLILSLMPDKIIALAEIFGYKGDRDEGLRLLMKAGGWSTDSSEPHVGISEEGLRRPLADICLLCFHLVISTVTYKGIDFNIAQNILEWNIRRFPEGVFYLLGQGRLLFLRSQPERAVKSYEMAMATQVQYRSLHYVSFWELAICNLSLWDITESLRYWMLLDAEATWSKACYAYGMAVCILHSDNTTSRTNEADQLLQKIPKVVHKIAGKSIPIEKFVARKARKFFAQGKRLMLAALELAYIFLAIDHAPRSILINKMLPEIDNAVKALDNFREDVTSYEGGHGYWDDYCLAHLLRGVCWRFIAYPERNAIVSHGNDSSLHRDEAAKNAFYSLQQVIQYGGNIEFEHYVLYHAHYELGRLYSCVRSTEKAREHFDLVSSGKALEKDPKARKGKYSMQSTLMMRTMANLESLEE